MKQEAPSVRVGWFTTIDSNRREVTYIDPVTGVAVIIPVSDVNVVDNESK